MTGTAARDVDVAIVGGGPVGLWLAAELRLAGVSTAVLEEAGAPMVHGRGLAVHARTLEVFAMRGISGEHVAAGRPIPALHFGMMAGWIDLSILDSPFPYMLAIPQRRTEELLEAHARALGADIRRNHRCVGVHDHGDHVTVEVEADGGRHDLSASYLVGCDGSGSMVRRSAGIDYVGESSTKTTFLADLELTDPPSAPVSRSGEHGSMVCVPLPGSVWRMVAFDRDRMHVSRDVPVTLQEVRESARRILGTDFGAHSPLWMARVGNAALQAASYRRGRVFLAGDAAHVHPPQGGQGLNLGVADAMNLGWKLAAAVNGSAPPWLLDSYHAERHPVGARVIQSSQAQNALACPLDGEQRAVRDLVAELIAQQPAVSAALAARIAGIDVAYAPRESATHPLAGRRVPDLQLTGAPAPSLFALLAGGRFQLIALAGGHAGLAALGRHARPGVDLVGAELTRAQEPWSQLSALLVRPDGHAAWVSDERDGERLAAQIRSALADWGVEGPIAG